MDKTLLFIVPTDEMGGAEQIIKQLAIHYQLAQKEVQVICLTRRSTKNGWKDFKGKIRYFKTSNVFVGFMLLSLYTFNKKFHLVFSSQVYINGLLGFLRSLRWYKTSKLIVRESTTIFLRFKGWRLWTYKLFYKIGYHNSDLIICQTELMQQQLITHVPSLKTNNIQVLQNPISLIDITNKAELTADFGNIEGEFIVGLGRMVSAKGFDILIHSFNQISEQYPNLKLLILGDGPERGLLENLVNQYKLTEKVLMPGYSFNPFPYLKAASVGVVSSRIEGYPNILLQMMALNNNIVCTNCAGGVEEIKGIGLCDTNDIESLTNALLAALSTSETNKNRPLFDAYLSKSSIDTFIAKMEN